MDFFHQQYFYDFQRISLICMWGIPLQHGDLLVLGLKHDSKWYSKPTQIDAIDHLGMDELWMLVYLQRFDIRSKVIWVLVK